MTDLEDDPYVDLDGEIIPFPEAVVGKRKKKRRAGVSGESIPVAILPAGLHYLGARFMAARAYKIFRQPGP